jgi:predicted Zn-dependent peptidase
MNLANKEIKEAIALIETAIRKIKIPPEELKRAKSKLVEYLKKHGA